MKSEWGTCQQTTARARELNQEEEKAPEAAGTALSAEK